MASNQYSSAAGGRQAASLQNHRCRPAAVVWCPLLQKHTPVFSSAVWTGFYPARAKVLDCRRLVPWPRAGTAHTPSSLEDSVPALYFDTSQCIRSACISPVLSLDLPGSVAPPASSCLGCQTLSAVSHRLRHAGFPRVRRRTSFANRIAHQIQTSPPPTLSIAAAGSPSHRLRCPSRPYDHALSPSPSFYAASRARPSTCETSPPTCDRLLHGDERKPTTRGLVWPSTRARIDADRPSIPADV